MVAVASHDTASAVIASPLNGSRAAYLSSGTWSLMGFESQTPFTNDTALAANITNEGGAEGRYRVLKNIMGLWWPYGCFSECFRSGKSTIFRRLSPQHRHFRPAASSSIPMTIALLILTRCAAKFRLRVGKRRNRSRKVMLNWRAVFSTVWRCCMPMCCMSWRSCVVKISRNCILSSQLHIVGGGCQNTLLNQLCADACGIRVIAGPVEASTLGNIGIQLMTLDELNNVDDFRELNNVDDFRQVVSTTANLTTFTPNPDSEIAHYVAQIHSTRQTKELCA